ncbi:MAG: DUF3147 domain-containing protein [Nitrospirota bacterium]
MKYLLYFLLGGTVTSTVTYLASTSRGFLAAFISTLPLASLSTFLLIYSSTGSEAVISYAKGLVVMLLPWMFYILSVIVLTPRITFLYSLVVGLFLFIIISYVMLSRYGLIT